MNKGNLLGGYALGDELLPDVLIDRKGGSGSSSGTASSKAWRVGLSSAFATFFGRPGLGRGNVAEHQLGQLVGLAVPPDLHDVVHALIDLGARLIRQQLVDDSLV